MSTKTLTEILDGFQNGEQRYDLDGYFREAITSIHIGIGATAVLDRVLKEHTILMRLHNEEVNKNRVAVAEVNRLAGMVLEPEVLVNGENRPELSELLSLRRKVQIMEDELASYREANEALQAKVDYLRIEDFNKRGALQQAKDAAELEKYKTYLDSLKQ